MNHITQSEDTVQTYLEKILAILDIEASVVEEELDESTTCFRIDCKADDARMLIGRNGKTLEALQFVVRQMCRTNMIENGPFIIDVLDYRSRRKRTLEEQAKKGAVAVLNGDTERFDLEAMNPYERRLVHNYLQEHFPELSSDSEGDGAERHIVISYKGLEEDGERRSDSSDEDEEGYDNSDEEDSDDREEEDEEELSDTSDSDDRNLKTKSR